MSNVGQRERATQNRVVEFFQQELNYSYLGDWHDRDGNRNIEPSYLRAWLTTQNIDAVLIKKAIRRLDTATNLSLKDIVIQIIDRCISRLCIIKYGFRQAFVAGVNHLLSAQSIVNQQNTK